MTLHSLAAHSTSQLRRLVNQMQDECDTLEKLASSDASVQRQLAQARERLHDALEATEDAIETLRQLQRIDCSAHAMKSPSRRA